MNRIAPLWVARWGRAAVRALLLVFFSAPLFASVTVVAQWATLTANSASCADVKAAWGTFVASQGYAYTSLGCSSDPVVAGSSLSAVLTAGWTYGVTVDSVTDDDSSSGSSSSSSGGSASSSSSSGGAAASSSSDFWITLTPDQGLEIGVAVMSLWSLAWAFRVLRRLIEDS